MKPITFCILDGWGISKKSLNFNSKLRPKAISQDNTDMIKVIKYELNNYKGDKKEINKILLIQSRLN